MIDDRRVQQRATHERRRLGDLPEDQGQVSPAWRAWTGYRERVAIVQGRSIIRNKPRPVASTYRGRVVPCPECDMFFHTEAAVKQHAAVKHLTNGVRPTTLSG